MGSPVAALGNSAPGWGGWSLAFSPRSHQGQRDSPQRDPAPTKCRGITCRQRTCSARSSGWRG